MYRVLVKGHLVYPFEYYSQALEFKRANGGKIYQKVDLTQFN